MPSKFSYSRSEKIKSKLLIDKLFSEANTLFIFPYKIYYLVNEQFTNSNLKVGVGVSNRFFKKAVDRNRIKRLMRESFRIHKLPIKTLLEKKEKHMVLFFLFVGKTLPDYALIESKMVIALNNVIKKLDEICS